MRKTKQLKNDKKQSPQGTLKNRVGTFENHVGISQNRVEIFENRVGIFSGLLRGTESDKITNCKSNNSTNNSKSFTL